MLELYHHGSSACAAKVRLVLAEKGLDWQGHYIDILKGEQFEPEYAKLNPRCVVPTLVHDGTVIRESTVICEYLGELFPDPPLIPDDPILRAEMRIWTKAVDEELHPATRVVTFAASHRYGILEMPEAERLAFIAAIPDPHRRELKRQSIMEGFACAEAKGALETFDYHLAWMERALSDGDWLVGAGYTLADGAMTIYVNRLDALSMSEMWIGKYPKVEAWWQRMQARPSFHPAIFEWLPDALRDEMKTNGRRSWPEAKALLAAA